MLAGTLAIIIFIILFVIMQEKSHDWLVDFYEWRKRRKLDV